MSLSILNCRNTEEYILTSTQLTCSQLIRGSAKEIFNPLTLCSLVLGGAVARSVELACLKLFSSSSISYLSRFAPQLASIAGVTIEGGVFAAVPMIPEGGTLSELGIGTTHGALVIGLSRFVGRYTHSSLVINWITQ